MVVRKNSRKRSLRKNRKKSKKRSLRKNRKKSQKRGGGKDSFWDWLPPVDTLAIRGICRKILNKGQSNSKIFVPYSDPVEYIQDFSFAYQEWQNEQGFGEHVGKRTPAKNKKLRENFIKAIGVIGATVGGIYMLSNVFYPTVKIRHENKDFFKMTFKETDEKWADESKNFNNSGSRIMGTYIGSIFALTTMGALTGSSEEKKKYKEVLDIVADEWNERHAYQITGKQIAKIITDNPKVKMDMKKIKILNKMNSNDRNLIAHQQAINLHQQAHNQANNNNAMMMHNQAHQQSMMMHNQTHNNAMMMHNSAMM
tara:strand:- start:439 stop:1371 length:933 start_codon:yes stop_codon:yes gene_type:complete